MVWSVPSPTFSTQQRNAVKDFILTFLFPCIPCFPWLNPVFSAFGFKNEREPRNTRKTRNQKKRCIPAPGTIICYRNLKLQAK